MLGQIIKFVAQDVQFQTCPFHFKLSILAIHTTGLHHELLFNKNKIIEICFGSYVTLDGLVRIALFKFIQFFFQNH